MVNLEMTDRALNSRFDLMDWKRTVFDLYRRIRSNSDPQDAWREWRRVRDKLIAEHPQSPISEDKRSEFHGLDYFDYDPEFRLVVQPEPTDPETYRIPTSGDGTYEFTRIGKADFELKGRNCVLEVYWLEGYGGGIFLPFRDATSGKTTYGACRYLLDTIKGADLGLQDGGLVLDFNFAYNPSCAYDPKWVCPLAPPPNRLDLSVEAGERFVQDN